MKINKYFRWIAMLCAVTMLLSPTALADDVYNVCGADVPEVIIPAEQTLSDVESDELIKGEAISGSAITGTPENIELQAAGNGTWQTAAGLAEGTTSSFTLPTKDSAAWYKVATNNNDEAIKLNFTGFQSGSGRIYAAIFSGSDLKASESAKSIVVFGAFNGNTSYVYKFESKDDYYIKLYTYSSDILAEPVNISYNIIAPDSNESNDRWQSATELARDVDISYTLNGPNDYDWFKITVTNPGEAIKLIFSNFDYTVTPIRYYLYSEDELKNSSSPKYLDSLTNFKINSSRSYKVNDAGNYYVRVDTNADNQCVTKPLRLRYEIVPGDANEINDTRQNATPLQDDVPMAFTLNGHNDEDWFTFDTTIESETVTFSFTGFETNKSNKIQYYVYEGTSTSSMLSGECSIVYKKSVSFLNPGTKYLRVIVNGTKPVENELKLTMSRTAIDDYEPNNTWQTATPMEENVPMQFNLPATTDIDWFKITVNNPDEAIQLNFRGFEVDSPMIKYSLYNGNDLMNLGNNASTIDGYYGNNNFNRGFNWSLSRTYKVTEPGNYYVKIFLSNASIITTPLTISYSTIASDNNENNDVWKRATMLQIDTNQSYTLNGHNDVDWFKITVNNPDEAIQLNFSGFKVDSPMIEYSLYSENDFINFGNDAGTIDGYYGSNSFNNGFNWSLSRTYKVTEPGNYYVKVYLSNASIITTPLTISYSVVPPDNNENNDVWKKAATLQNSINKLYTLTGHNDIDWFKITVNNPDEAIQLNFSGFEVNSPMIKYSLYSENDFINFGNDASTIDGYYGNNSYYNGFNWSLSRTYKVTEPGNYYVKVFLDNNSIITTPLTISYSVVPPDDNENNDSYDNATSLNQNTEISYTLNGHNDNDWFKIDGVTNGDTINLTFDNFKTNSPSVNYYVYYYDEVKLEVKLKTSGDTSKYKTAKYTSIENGTYFIRLTSNTSVGIYTPLSFRYTISRGDTPVESIELNNTSLTLNAGVTAKLIASTIPSYSANKNVTWSSSDDSVVTVDSYGVVTAIATGNAVVTAVSEDGSHPASCSVTVVPAVRVSSITLDKQSHTLAYEGSFTLNATIMPENATNKNIKWTSDNESVAVVASNGRVTAVGKGIVRITATSEDGGFAAHCDITVPEYSTAVRSVSLSPTMATVYLGDSLQLNATVSPANATNKKIIWSSSDSSTVAVDDTGKLNAKKLGSAVITATTDEGGYKAYCTVTVEPQPVRVTGIKLNIESLSLAVTGSSLLEATVSPANATDKSVKWSSSNTAAVTVSSNGKVTAVGLGYAEITATTSDGSFKAKCAVTVSTTALPGDVNYDGAVDAADAILMLKYDVGLVSLTTAQRKIADVNADGFIDAADAILVLKYNAGLIDSFK